jgi:hypothetical protein
MIKPELSETVAQYNDWYWLIGAIATLEKLKQEAIAPSAKN